MYQQIGISIANPQILSNSEAVDVDFGILSFL